MRKVSGAESWGQNNVTSLTVPPHKHRRFQVKTIKHPQKEQVGIGKPHHPSSGWSRTPTPSPLTLTSVLHESPCPQACSHGSLGQNAHPLCGPNAATSVASAPSSIPLKHLEKTFSKPHIWRIPTDKISKEHEFILIPTKVLKQIRKKKKTKTYSMNETFQKQPPHFRSDLWSVYVLFTRFRIHGIIVFNMFKK